MLFESTLLLTTNDSSDFVADGKLIEKETTTIMKHFIFCAARFFLGYLIGSFVTGSVTVGSILGLIFAIMGD